MLIPSVRKHFAHGFRKSKALIFDNGIYSVSSSFAKLLKEADPADRLLSVAGTVRRNSHLKIL